MTVLWGDTGKIAYGPLKTYNVSLSAQRETLLGSPLALPTTEPTTAQISFTVQTSDFPTITPTPLGVKYTAIIFGSGKNTDASSQSVSFRMLKNGSSVATGSAGSTPTSQFWTHTYMQFFDIAVGDVLEVKLWATSVNVNVDFYAIVVHPTRINVGTALLNKDVSYSNLVAHPVLTLGTPGVQATNFNSIAPSSSLPNQVVNLTANCIFAALSWNSTFLSGKVGCGDAAQSVTTLNHATNHPYYQRNSIPTTMTFREVLR